ncbi:hypothetical protein DPMN_126012 [Dreissena polymorpha]|uniref:Uncharacterized protein n=1 Tax=Dreissena polymorpha TaxID=45954 RepID=A0A9D4JU29_DREPO|nr:hypothetical protein DPMN_126012 [Dreissena polymorpha]
MGKRRQPWRTPTDVLKKSPFFPLRSIAMPAFLFSSWMTVHQRLLTCHSRGGNHVMI